MNNLEECSVHYRNQILSIAIIVIDIIIINYI